MELTPDAKTQLVVDDRGERIVQGEPVYYVGLGQPDARTQALTGKRSLMVR